MRQISLFKRFVALCAFIAMSATTLSAQRAVVVDDMTYFIQSVEIGGDVTHYAKLQSTRLPKNEIVKLSIPESVELDGITYPVTTIGSNVFSDAIHLKEIKIGKSISRIESEAFSDCSSLTTLTLPSEVIYVGEKAFSGCTSLTSVIIENGTEKITLGKEAFSGTGLKKMSVGRPFTGLSLSGTDVESVALGDVITNLPDRSFAELPLLKDVTLPENLKTIGKECFLNCPNLVNINIPSEVEQIKASAFKGCVKISPSIPSGLITLGDNAFDGTSLRSAGLPRTLTSLGKYAFANCNKLTEASLPNSITSIPEGLFFNCENLKNLNLPENINAIGEYAFASCRSLNDFTIPSGVTKLEKSVFEGCRFSTLTISSSVETIGMNALWCEIDDLIIEASDTPLCFHKTWYGYVAYPPTHGSPEGYFEIHPVTTITNVHLNREIARTGDNTPTPFRRSGISSVTLGGEVTSLDDYFFEGCKNLKSIYIPSTLQSLPTGIFAESGINEVTFEDGLSDIAAEAFRDCPNLRNVILPASVRTIGNNTFTGTALQTLICKATIPPAAAGNPFTASSYKTTSVYVPSEALHKYQTSVPWLYFDNISAIDSGIIPETADNENTHTEYFDLYGRKVEPSDVAAGIYMMRQGSKTTKIIR